MCVCVFNLWFVLQGQGFIYLRFCGENEVMLIIEEWNRLIISRFWQKKYYTILYCNNLQMEWIRFGCESETFLDLLKDFFSFERILLFYLGPGNVNVVSVQLGKITFYILRKS